jgi:hypothetical protein
MNHSNNFDVSARVVQLASRVGPVEEVLREKAITAVEHLFDYIQNTNLHNKDDALKHLSTVVDYFHYT